MMEILRADELSLDRILDRSSRQAAEARAQQAADRIIEEVQREGDAALLRYAQQFDRAQLQALEVTAEELQAGVAAVDGAFLEILQEAAANIRAFHSRQRQEGFVITDRPGIVMGQRVLPLQRVGVYVPGGTAAYPSTVLMDAIPARLAGVETLVMATPPRPDGSIQPEILAAAKLAGVDRIFKAGGAGAVAALAYGTCTIPRVDKIVGPGNAYVAAAKRRVFGLVDIDMIAGPSEILIVADGGCDPAHLAADLLSQAEHDPLAAAVLITDSAPLAAAVAEELQRQLEALPRKEIAAASLAQNGRLVVAAGLRQAVEIANAIAPEHLELAVAEPFALLPLVRNAGSVFLGCSVPEALGDYFAGPNHTLPTGGTARFSSPLGVDDFTRRSSFLYYSPDALSQAGPKVAAFARREGLEGHARSALIRCGGLPAAQAQKEEGGRP